MKDSLLQPDVLQICCNPINLEDSRSKKTAEKGNILGDVFDGAGIVLLCAKLSYSTFLNMLPSKYIRL